MATMLQKSRNKAKKDSSIRNPQVVRTNYTSKTVSIPRSFLSPLRDPSIIEVNQIDFANTPLPQYKGLYAVVLDNVLSQSECDELIHMAEQSAGGHDPSEPMENNGWKPAMVNAGRNHEFLALDYRNSDRIIWDNEEIMNRLWKRITQVKEMKDYFSVMEGEKYGSIVGDCLVMQDGRWVIAPKGPNERMRFLKYGAGQFFRPHCDGTYETPDGQQRSFFTLHLYLNDSAQALGIKEPMFGFRKGKKADGEEEMLRGGATTFHSMDKKKRLDVDPKAGRVLIFQQSRLYHSGDDVTAGIKYTVRSDLMYQFEAEKEDGE
ncbi:hypothetical protein LHYA1_G001088 [Lachnellula hyalina]|uniref:Prolyl 4-hydroxylase alpha subunit domain-containing protein n=1 Tax=Lachnellula hyalina TaxID=1316788 RepID=A0A8H8R7W8_9HELO|nr:uncharacterized protein LHYA1_G001088 [Lachnellula hyalina]TVY30180.1 hypothetical protein LHYA1_G001088 [Lachnellula hyalina]